MFWLVIRPEVDVLKAAVQKAKEAARERPLTEQLVFTEFHRMVSEAHRGFRDQEGRRGPTVEPIAAGDFGPGFKKNWQWPRIVSIPLRGLQSWTHVHVDLLKIRKMQPRTFVRSGQTSFGGRVPKTWFHPRIAPG